MKSILIIVFNDLAHDARVNRQINFLKDNYLVTVASFSASSAHRVKHLVLKKVKPSLTVKLLGGLALLFRFYDRAYELIYNQKANLEALKPYSFDIIISNDIETLPLAFKLSHHPNILFDAHEYAPRHFEDKLIWRILFRRFNEYLCHNYLPQVKKMTTVGAGLANEYANYFHVKPEVITNANYYKDLDPIPTGDPIKLVHHGAANPSRQIELMINMMDHLDSHFTLDLILLTPAIANRKTRNYLSYIKELAARNTRVRILPPVKSHEVVDLIHQYDVGIFLLPPVNFNYKNTLPNKLFDYIQARLAIAVGPTPEMEAIVNKFELGVVSKDFTAESFSQAIRSLTREKIDYYKKNSNTAARELNAEKNKVIFNQLVAALKD